ncbi:MAG TPA: hypothetical protein VN698_02445 [Bacteroidia bacterium]|nr:hypothetical protein [Bacteroidia bacterium]
MHYDDLIEKEAKINLAEPVLNTNNSLRDHFAGLSMQNMLKHALSLRYTVINTESIATEAYKMADAMLKARELNNKE